MTAETRMAQRVACPSCRRTAKRVSPVTVRALLKDAFADPVADDQPACCDASGNGQPVCTPVTADTVWRFCGSQDCEVVYFAEDGDTRFTKPQLKVAVGVKERTGERPLCYCFGHSVATITGELRVKGRSDALGDIRRKMQDPGCRCETENPSGSCCLGSVTKGIQIAQEESGMAGADVRPPAALDKPSTPSMPFTGRGEKIAKVGTVLSAIVASSCCWLPLLLLAVGVSGAGIAATLEAYRPIFIMVTFGFLAAAFYFTYRPRKARGDAGHDCCAPKEIAGAEATVDCCVSSGKRRLSVMAVNKIMLWVVTVLAIAFLLFPHYVGLLLGTAGGNGGTATATMNRAVLEIDGMTCEGCAAIAAEAIRQVPGVLAVEVSYDTGQAVVGTDACCPVPKETILIALKNVGYSGSFRERPPGPRATTDAPANESSRRPPSPAGRTGQAHPSGELRKVTLAVSGMT